MPFISQTDSDAGDVRRALDMPGNLDTAPAVHTATYLTESLPYIVGKRAQAPVGSVVRLEVDGHDHAALIDVLSAVPFRPGRPTFVIANTHKGHPISYMSNNVAWHHKVPSEAELEQALAELAALAVPTGVSV